MNSLQKTLPQTQEALCETGLASLPDLIPRHSLPQQMAFPWFYRAASFCPEALAFGVILRPGFESRLWECFSALYSPAPRTGPGT